MTRNQRNKKYQSAAWQLKAIAHPVRLAILDVLLASEEACVCHMEVVLGQRQAYLSQHLMALRESGVVADRRDGRNIFYRIKTPDMLNLIETIKKLNNELQTSVPLTAAACVCPKCSHVSHPEGVN